MPCDRSMSLCKRSCQHRQLVEEYRAARLNDEMRREDDTHGFVTELAEYPPIVTFREWLLAMRKAC